MTMYIFEKICNVQIASTIFDAIGQCSKIRLKKGACQPLMEYVARDANIDTEIIPSTYYLNGDFKRECHQRYQTTGDNFVTRQSGDWYRCIFPRASLKDLYWIQFKEFDSGLRVHVWTQDDKFWPILFGRTLHKLCGNFGKLRELVTINGRTLTQGEWFASLMFELSGDTAGALATIDEAIDRGN